MHHGRAKMGQYGITWSPDAITLELRLGRARLASPLMTPPPCGIFRKRLGKLKCSKATHYVALIICASIFKIGNSRCLNVSPCLVESLFKAHNSLLVHVGHPSK